MHSDNQESTDETTNTGRTPDVEPRIGAMLFKAYVAVVLIGVASTLAEILASRRSEKLAEKVGHGVASGLTGALGLTAVIRRYLAQRRSRTIAESEPEHGEQQAIELEEGQANQGRQLPPLIQALGSGGATVPSDTRIAAAIPPASSSRRSATRASSLPPAQ